MLIPERIADAPTQRFYATSLFIFLQALKFYDYIQLYGAPPSSETIFAIKWIGIDAAYLLLVPKLKIPWLSFRLTTAMLQIAIISILNICLSARIPLSASTIGAALLKIVYDRELSVLEHNVKISDILKNSSRILGQHTINILPESTARLNPTGSCYCVDAHSKSTISVPVRLNSTIPMLLQYSRIDPETNEIYNYNITGKRLKSIVKQADHKAKVWDLSLPVTEPGLYRLERVQDSSKLDVRLYRAQALVVVCPSATLVIPERLKHSPDRCTGDLDELSIRASGLPPLRIKYNRWIEGRERVSTIDSVKPSEYTSPLMVGHNEQVREQQSSQQVLSLAGVHDVLWARSRQVDVHLNASLATAGAWSYTIEEVEDACGNVVNFSTRSSKNRHSLKAIEAPGLSETQISKSVEAPTYHFRVHERPKIAFRGCNSEIPSKLLEGTSTKLFFDISASDPGPYEVHVDRGSPDSLTAVSSTGSGDLKIFALASRHQAFVVDEPGLYRIRDFSSKFCKGIVEMPASCTVFTPTRPAVAISFEPIHDKCAGAIGLLADLSFTGSPPFDISWKVSKDGKVMLHRKKVDRVRHQLRFTPDEAGHFVYQFTSLDDANYKGIPLQTQDYSTEQIVYPLAGAHFVKKETSKCCIDDSVSIPLRLVGSGPWNLVYEIIHGGKRQRFEMNNLQEASQVIETPKLTKGGVHTLTLVSVQDSNGCKTPLEASDVVIEVRRERPSAAFYTISDKNEITVIEGASVDLPLRLTGDGPWNVAYSTPDKKEVIQIHDQNAKLSVKAAGSYRLLNVRDSFCPGYVDEKHATFDIRWFPRPSFSIPVETANYTAKKTYVRQEICEGDEDTFDIGIFGAPPFAISYERTYLGVKGIAQDKQSLQLNAALPTVSIKSKTSPAGTWRYSFIGISDARYDLPPSAQRNVLELEQFVNSRPTATFTDNDKIYNYCMELDLADQEADRIPLNFKGQVPFKARFRIKHELTGITEYLTDGDIQTHSWSLEVPKSMLTLGKHIVSLAEVSDANGCSRRYTERDSRIFVAISERPTILPVSSRTEFCVGDRLSFALQGSPPFKIAYQFDGAQKRATVNGPIFSRVAERPGDFSIVSLQDSASKCKVSVNGFEKVIHDIPSVRVSEGKTIVESIHEGDQAEIIFHLYGTPPFSLTYTRSDVGRGRHNKVLETHSVSGIWEDKYIIHSSVAGTFAATEVHDAHCRISLQN